MFKAATGPRLFALPPGVDYPVEIVRGLRNRVQGADPLALARVQLIVNTRRMARRLEEVFQTGPASLHPQITLVTDLADPKDLAQLPARADPLQRRLRLAELVRALLDAAPDLAPRAAAFDLADSLAALLDEVVGEGQTTDSLRNLNIADHSAYWQRSVQFLDLADRYMAEIAPDLDAEAWQRAALALRLAQWQDQPPDHPILVVGSTGSRGTTADLMATVASLPQGAVILPGFDRDLGADTWVDILGATTAEDHPQYRFAALMDRLAVTADQITPWTDTPAPDPLRNRVLSLALRPAPVTDQWLTEGPDLGDLTPLSDRMTLIEAPSPRDEAGAIALCLRQAVEEGRSAALITPDRDLTRRVTAALDRWGLRPDDSAGIPLHLSAPGRLLRLCAALPLDRMTGEDLIALLKHPLVASGDQRGLHQLLTERLELHLRAKGPAFPTAADLAALASNLKDSQAEVWCAWLAKLLSQDAPNPASPAAQATHLHQLAEGLAAGWTQTGSGALWDEPAGEAAQALITSLAATDPQAEALNTADFAALLTALLQREEVRSAVTPDERIKIWGTLEARVSGPELVILGGLNDGVWPALPPPDPWLNRALRREAGLLLPDRRIGLSAHDFQIAAAAPQIVLSRAVRDAEAETVPSRWVNRLTNLLSGLPDQGGQAALTQMRAKGQALLTWAKALDTPTEHVPKAPRPSPRPPVAARPTQLRVTEVERLIRDPYAIYARRVLDLAPLDPLRPDPDALTRGIALHTVMERFTQTWTGPLDDTAAAALMAQARAVLDQAVPWPTAQRAWLASFASKIDRYLQDEGARRARGTPTHQEVDVALTVGETPVTLKGRADRIDLAGDGTAALYDYKTGAIPTAKQQTLFALQLPLLAHMAGAGGLVGLPPLTIAHAAYIGLGAKEGEFPAKLDQDRPAKVWAGLTHLLDRYQTRDQGYTARRMAETEGLFGDYDHLARYGEWDVTAHPQAQEVGDE